MLKVIAYYYVLFKVNYIKSVYVNSNNETEMCVAVQLKRLDTFFDNLVLLFTRLHNGRLVN